MCATLNNQLSTYPPLFKNLGEWLGIYPLASVQEIRLFVLITTQYTFKLRRKPGRRS